MNGRVALVAVLILAPMGCQRKDDFPAWPPFTMTVPADIPDQMTVTDKDGVTHEANGKQLWADGYRAGWKRCVWDYERGHLDLAAERVEVPLIGHYVIVARGWEAGYLACWQAIRAEKRGPAEPSAPPDQGGRR